MSNYTGPVTIKTFQQGDDAETRFAIILHDNSEDIAGLARILLRYQEDGYVPVNSRKAYMVNGSLVHPSERYWRPAFA